MKLQTQKKENQTKTKNKTKKNSPKMQNQTTKKENANITRHRNISNRSTMKLRRLWNFNNKFGWQVKLREVKNRFTIERICYEKYIAIEVLQFNATL